MKEKNVLQSQGACQNRKWQQTHDDGSFVFLCSFVCNIPHLFRLLDEKTVLKETRKEGKERQKRS
jgi:hypothetical protein